MKICMVNPFFLPYNGGTEKHLYEVCRRLARTHEVTVLTAKLPGTKSEEYIDDIRVVRTKALIIKKAVHPLPPPFPIAPHMFLKVKEMAKDNDVVHFHNRFNYSLLDFLMVKLEKKALAMTIHNSRPRNIDFFTDLVGGIYDDLIGKRMMSGCTKIAAVSKSTLMETVPKSMWHKSIVIYNGVNLKEYNPKMKSEKFKEKYGDYFFCVARLVEQKGLKYLLEAMRSVKANLVLLGRGPLEKSLKKMAPDNVKFITRRVSEEELVRLYGSSYAFVLPSLYEPFGMVLCEAMAMKKAVIGTKVGGIPEIVTNDTGLLVEPRDPSDLAEKMNFLLENPDIARKMGKRGRKRVERYFTWDKTAEGYEKFYRDML